MVSAEILRQYTGTRFDIDTKTFIIRNGKVFLEYNFNGVIQLDVNLTTGRLSAGNTLGTGFLDYATLAQLNEHLANLNLR